MENDFCTKNMTPFKINNVEYTLHNYILETMSIFNALKDCKMDCALEIHWDISVEKINTVFHCVVDRDYDKMNKYYVLLDRLEIIAFMKYLGISDEIMKGILAIWFDGNVIDYIDKCSSVTYDDNMMFIFDNVHNWYLIKLGCGYMMYELTEKIDVLVGKITKRQFPINFQTKVIKNIVLTYTLPLNQITIREIVHDWCIRFNCRTDSNIIIDKINNHIQIMKIEKMQDMAEILADYITESLILRDSN